MSIGLSADFLVGNELVASGKPVNVTIQPREIKTIVINLTGEIEKALQRPDLISKVAGGKVNLTAAMHFRFELKPLFMLSVKLNLTQPLQFDGQVPSPPVAPRTSPQTYSTMSESPIPLGVRASHVEEEVDLIGGRQT